MMRLWPALASASGVPGCAVGDHAVDRTTMVAGGVQLYLSGENTRRTPANFEDALNASLRLRTVVPRVMQESHSDAAVR